MRMRWWTRWQGTGLAKAALDVFSVEPIPQGHPILKLDNVTLTPHRAGNCSNLAAISLDIIVEDIERYFRGEPLAHARLEENTA